MKKICDIDAESETLLLLQDGTMVYFVSKWDYGKQLCDGSLDIENYEDEVDKCKDKDLEFPEEWHLSLSKKNLLKLARFLAAQKPKATKVKS